MDFEKKELSGIKITIFHNLQKPLCKIKKEKKNISKSSHVFFRIYSKEKFEKPYI